MNIESKRFWKTACLLVDRTNRYAGGWMPRLFSTHQSIFFLRVLKFQSEPQLHEINLSLVPVSADSQPEKEFLKVCFSSMC